MLYRMTGDWAEAEDLALEAFVQLYRRPPANQENLGGWLYRVASNLGLNALRSHRRRKDREEEAGRLKLMDAPEIDPAKALEIADEQQHVRQTLALLKPRDAQALLLRYSGLSYAELAAALQVAPSSVGTLLARAEAAFKKQYGRR
jgi:RNA polymerase sigma-70 factor (ECF subfamily)